MPSAMFHAQNAGSALVSPPSRPSEVTSKATQVSSRQTVVKMEVAKTVEAAYALRHAFGW